MSISILQLKVLCSQLADQLKVAMEAKRQKRRAQIAAELCMSKDSAIVMAEGQGEPELQVDQGDQGGTGDQKARGGPLEASGDPTAAAAAPATGQVVRGGPLEVLEQAGLRLADSGTVQQMNLETDQQHRQQEEQDVNAAAAAAASSVAAGPVEQSVAAAGIESSEQQEEQDVNVATDLSFGAAGPIEQSVAAAGIESSKILEPEPEKQSKTAEAAANDQALGGQLEVGSELDRRDHVHVHEVLPQQGLARSQRDQRDCERKLSAEHLQVDQGRPCDKKGSGWAETESGEEAAAAAGTDREDHEVLPQQGLARSQRDRERKLSAEHSQVDQGQPRDKKFEVEKKKKVYKMEVDMTGVDVSEPRMTRKMKAAKTNANKEDPKKNETQKKAKSAKSGGAKKQKWEVQ